MSNLFTIEEIRNEMESAAASASTNKLKEMGGDFSACGFAWVTICPHFKGNTKPGKHERVELESLGAEKDWTGKNYMIWNPGKCAVQSIDVLEAGAIAAARVLKNHGFNAYSGSRLD